MCRSRSLLGALALMLAGSCVAATTYSYDSLSRLTGVDYGNGSTISYSYDAAGNRLTMVVATAASTVAGAPTGVVAVGGNGEVTLSFTVPGSNGGSPITGYTATASPGGLTGSCIAPCTAITIGGLAPYVPYTFTVVATNGVGNSATSTASNAVLPHADIFGDANDDGYSDVFFQHITGPTHLWLLKGTPVPGSYALSNLGPALRVVGLGDVNGDGIVDLVARDGAGNNRLVLLAELNPGLAAGSTPTLPAAGLNWAIAGVGDFDGDGKADVLWREVAGYNFLYYGYNAGAVTQSAVAGVSNDWKVGAIADFDGDGKDDILWRNINGMNFLWHMNGPAVKGQAAVAGLGADWQLAGVADFNRDGKPDLLWRNINGANGLWLMNDAAVAQVINVPGVSTDWRIVGTGDYNRDGYADILWEQTANGTRVIWFLQAGVYQGEMVLPGTGDIGWQVINPKSNR